MLLKDFGFVTFFVLDTLPVSGILLSAPESPAWRPKVKKQSKTTQKPSTKTVATRVRHSDVLVMPGPKAKDKAALETIPEQAALIVACVAKAPKGTLRTALVSGLVKAGLKTKQTPAAIWAFYRARLEQGKFISTKAVELDEAA